MKFTTGAMVGDLSGSIGSTTASRNRFGPYFRSKVIPVNPNTTRQQTIRTLFATLVNAWTNTLTVAQRDDWRNWAAMTTIQGKDGNPINITGQNAYVRFNTIRLQIGGTRVDVAPLAFNNGNPVTSFETEEDAELGVIDIDMPGTAMATTINVDGGASGIGDVAVFLGGPVNASREFFKGPYQLSDSLAFIADETTVTWGTIITALQNQIDPADGQFRSIRFRMVYDDGRLSESFEALANVETASV